MIIALAGRIIDPLDSAEKRFPLQMKDVVYDRIRRFFHDNDVRILVGSAACGADLLAQKAARELKIERHIILPFNREKFRATSVARRPGAWDKIFDEICDESEREGNVIVLEGLEDDEEKAYSAATTELLKRAESLRSKKEKILAVAVWEGTRKSETDETASFIEKARTRNITVAVISTLNHNY